MMTINDLRKRDENRDNADGDEMYAGGAGRAGGSGQNIIDPGGQDFVRSIMTRARSGVGTPPTGVRRTITLYSNGFIVDDGEFRSSDVSENKSFLRDLQRGLCPRELQADDPNQTVDVQLIDKHKETFEEPAYKAFQGSGQTLGGIGSDVQNTTTHDEQTGEAKLITVDESVAIFDVQIRLANRSRVLLRVNATHTVGDIKRHLCALNSKTGSNFVLASGFPPKELKNMEQTVQDAGLEGAVVSQRLL
eukprot:g540.t1